MNDNAIILSLIIGTFILVMTAVVIWRSKGDEE